MVDVAEIPSAQCVREDVQAEEWVAVSGVTAKDGNSNDQKDDNRKRASKSTSYKQECASLCFKNLTYNTSVNELQEFLKAAEIRPDNIELHLDGKGDFRGTAFVTFSEPTEAAAALDLLGDSIELGGRRVKVETRRKGKRDRFATAREALVEILQPDEIEEVETAINEFMENPKIRYVNLPKDRAGKMEWSAPMRKYAHALAEKKGLTHSTKATTENSEDAYDAEEQQRRRSVSVYLAKDRLSRQSLVDVDPARKAEMLTRESKQSSRRAVLEQNKKNSDARLSGSESRRTRPTRVTAGRPVSTMTTSTTEMSMPVLTRPSAPHKQQQQRAPKPSAYEQGSGHKRSMHAAANSKWNAEYAPKGTTQTYSPALGVRDDEQQWALYDSRWTIQPTPQDSVLAFMAHQWMLASAAAQAQQMYNAQLHRMLYELRPVLGEESAWDREQESQAGWERQRNLAKHAADYYFGSADPSVVAYQ